MTLCRCGHEDHMHHVVQAKGICGGTEEEACSCSVYIPSKRRRGPIENDQTPSRQDGARSDF